MVGRVIAALALAAAVLVLATVAVEAPGAIAPTASATQGQYCPPGEVRRRATALRRYRAQMKRQRVRYFRFVRNKRKRAIFVRKQKAQERALIRAVRRCR